MMYFIKYFLCIYSDYAVFIQFVDVIYHTYWFAYVESMGKSWKQLLQDLGLDEETHSHYYFFNIVLEDLVRFIKQEKEI